MGFSEFEIFLFGLDVLYFWIDLVFWALGFDDFAGFEKIVILRF